MSNGITIGAFRLNAGAPAYSFGVGTLLINFTGAGIVNNSANAPTFTVVSAVNSPNPGSLTFNGFGTSAANAAINIGNESTLYFLGGSTASNATITNDGRTAVTRFLNSSPGNATITSVNGGSLQIVDSTSGSATIIANSGGVTEFVSANGTSSVGTARLITNAGGQTNFNTLNVTVGSIEGAGTYVIGLAGIQVSSTLSVGSNNLSTTVSGVIAGTGPLVKIGSGTLTLTGANTYSGGTTVSGGVLQGTTTGLQSSILNNAAVVFDQSGAGTYAGVMSGTGSLTIQGTGTVNLTGANTYSGGTTVSGGTLQGTTTSLQGSILNNARVVLDQGGAGTYAGMMSGTGSLILQGAGTVTLTGANTYSGGTTVSAGILQGTTSSLQGNILNNAAVVLDQGGAGTYAGAMSGTGSLTIQGAGMVNFTGANSFTGPTTVNSGTFAVNGSLAGSVTVNSAANLSGSGNIGGNVTNTGTLAPGNAGSALTIGGNLVHSSGATYQVGVNAAGQSDRINVGGAATLNGGTVQVVAVSGTYSPSTTYTILKATGGLSGTFSGLNGNFAFLVSSLSYDPNNVYLTLTTSFSGGAQNPNQRAVGSALDLAAPGASGDFRTVINALSLANSTQGAAALTAISGVSYAGFSTTMAQNAQLFMNNLASQAGSAGGGNRVMIAEACDVACDTTSPALWGAWGGAVGGTGIVGAGLGTGTVTYNVGGFAGGLDRRFNADLLAGVTVGYTAGQQWIGGLSGRGMSDTFQAGLYGSFTQGPLYLDGLAGYAYSSNRSWRNIALPGLSIRTAQGQTGANQFYGQLETGYRIDIGHTAEAYVTPFARLQGYTATQNAFSEFGAQSLDLNIAAQTTNSLRSVLGAVLGGSVDMGWRDKLAAQFRLGWTHEYASTDRPVSASFAGAPTIPFTTFGASPQRDGVLLGLSANTQIADGTSLYLRYEGNINGQDNTHALTAGVRVVW